MPTLAIGGDVLEYRLDVAAPGDDRSPLVFLHDGLGSIEQWRSFPVEVSRACGQPTTLVYSRPGYGRSSPRLRPWPVSYMHDEALRVLPAVLAGLGLTRPVVVGHSDGASIALIHAGAGHPVAGLILVAPHVFVEDRSISGIAAAKEAYRSTPLRERLGRYHDDVDGVFWGWNDVWLSSDFRDWNIVDQLTEIDAPILVIQGERDEYGTLAQLAAIEDAVRGPYDQIVVPAGAHALPTGPSDDLVAAIAAFYRRSA